MHVHCDVAWPDQREGVQLERDTHSFLRHGTFLYKRRLFFLNGCLPVQSIYGCHGFFGITPIDVVLAGRHLKMYATSCAGP